MDKVLDTKYHQAVAAGLAQKEAHQALFRRLQPHYDTYYNAVANHGDKTANELFGSEHQSVKEIETSAAALSVIPKTVTDALVDTLCQEMRVLSFEAYKAHKSLDRPDPRYNEIDPLRTALNRLDTFRSQHLDGVYGKLWEVAKTGAGFDIKERDRMINRILSVWCEGYLTKPILLRQALVTIGNLPTNEPGASSGNYADLDMYAEGYPFILVDDMKRALEWTETDVEALSAALDRYEATGSFNDAGMSPRGI